MFSVYRPSRKQWTCYFPVAGQENRYLQFVANKQIESTFLKFLRHDIINDVNIRDLRFLQRSCWRLKSFGMLHITDVSKCRAIVFRDKQSKILNTNLQRDWSFLTDYTLTNDPVTEWIMDIIAKLVVAHLFRESSMFYEPESIWSYFVLSHWNTVCTSHFLRYSNTLLSSHLARISKHVSSNFDMCLTVHHLCRKIM